MRQTDFMGYWYTARSRYGGDDTFKIALLEHPMATKDIVWHRFQHRSRDGAGALLELCQHHGIDCSTKPKRSHPPSFLSVLKQQLSKLHRIRSRKPTSNPAEWRYNSLASKDTDASLRWHIFTQAETRLLLNYYAFNRQSMATALLTAVNQMAHQQLCRNDLPDQTLRWLFPVDLRRYYSLPSRLQNHSSGIYVNLAHNDTPSSTQSKIREQIRCYNHFWYWHLANLGKWIGLPGVLLLYRLGLGEQTNNAGSCAFLGQWSADATESSRAIIASPLSSRSYPISPVGIVWGGKLCLSLKIHHSVLPETMQQRERVIKTCMDQWVKLVRETPIREEQPRATA